MKMASTALAAAGLLILGACGSSDPSDTANAADEMNVVADDPATATLGPEDTLGNQANALEAEPGNPANAVGENLTDTGNAAEATANGQ